MRQKTVLFLFFLMVPALLLAHPHFSKTVSADLDGNTVKVNFTTYPYNESHLAQVSDGFVFHCGRATLSLGAPITINGQTVPAGDYQVRAQAESIDVWTLYLVSGGGSDLSQGVKLTTQTLTGLPSSHHLNVDLYSGHESTDGKLILAVAFGERKLEGVLG